MLTAISLAIVVACGCAAYAAWAFHWVKFGAALWPFIVGLPFAFLAVTMLFTTLWFVLAWWFGAKPPASVRLTLRSFIAMYCRECWALARSVPRMILYRWLMPTPAPARAELPIILLHGVGCNAGVWAGFRRHWEGLGNGSTYALSYGPALHSIELFAEQLATKISTVQADTGATQVILVAHSMGGLVARAYLRRFGDAKVRRLVTIGTPHDGSMHAWLMFGQSLAQMRPGNPWLAELNRTANATTVPTVSIWSWHDSMVAPQTSSRIDWGENVVLAGIAHNTLLDHREVWAIVDAQVAVTAATTSGSPG